MACYCTTISYAKQFTFACGQNDQNQVLTKYFLPHILHFHLHFYYPIHFCCVWQSLLPLLLLFFYYLFSFEAYFPCSWNFPSVTKIKTVSHVYQGIIMFSFVIYTVCLQQNNIAESELSYQESRKNMGRYKYKE